MNRDEKPWSVSSRVSLLRRRRGARTRAGSPILSKYMLPMRRADKRWFCRTLLASRGRWGRALPLISKVADRGVVWPLLGAALAVRRSTRRTGVAGVGAVVVTSAATWVIQQAVQRDRPSELTALLTRGSARRPSSSSFPSTHAANAFTFAAAAATLCPRLGVVLVPAAAAIGVARIGIAHHYPSDVVAGALIGASIGLGIGIFVKRTYPPWSSSESRPSPQVSPLG